MMNQIKSPLSYLLVCGLLLLSQPAAALHSVMLAVPDHAEEALNWCGPATGKMIMGGYPSGSCTVSQEDIWMSIQANKVESQWDTDPAGLRETLKSGLLCPLPPSASWSIYARTDAESLMHSIAYWMTVNNYPAAGLMDTSPHNSHLPHGEHWVAIRGIITDEDPTTHSDVELEFIWFNDPAVDLGDPALVRFVSGDTWYSEQFPVSKAGSSYLGKYVAIIEPPQIAGRAVAAMPVLMGKLIMPDEARQFAKRWIKEYKLADYESYQSLRGATQLEPLLVNAEHGGYYIIPYSTDKQQQLASSAIIVNAYTGAFQEVGSFAPVPYLSKEAAIELTQQQLGSKTDNISAELIYPQGERVISRYFPIWKVSADNRDYGVTRQGKFLNTLPTREFFVVAPGKSPAGLAFDKSHLWSLDRDQKNLNSFDPQSGALQHSYPLRLKDPRALSHSDTDLWIADQEERKLVAINPNTGEQRTSFNLPIPTEKGFNSIEGMAWDGNYLWIAYFAGFSSSINKIDPANGELLQSIYADCHPKGLESDGTHLWTLCYNGESKPAVIDQRRIMDAEHEMLKTRQFIKTIEGKAPSGLTYDGQYLWYNDQQKNRVRRVFPGNTTHNK